MSSYKQTPGILVIYETALYYSRLMRMKLIHNLQYEGISYNILQYIETYPHISCIQYNRIKSVPVSFHHFSHFRSLSTCLYPAPLPVHRTREDTQKLSVFLRCSNHYGPVTPPPDLSGSYFSAILSFYENKVFL